MQCCLVHLVGFDDLGQGDYIFQMYEDTTKAPLRARRKMHEEETLDCNFVNIAYGTYGLDTGSE